MLLQFYLLLVVAGICAALRAANLGPSTDAVAFACIASDTVPSSTSGKSYAINFKVTAQDATYDSQEVSVVDLWAEEFCVQCQPISGGVLHNIGHGTMSGLQSGKIYRACAHEALRRSLKIWVELVSL